MAFLKSVIYVAVIGILAHYVGESLPRRLFCETRFPFCSFPFERGGKLYKVIGIRHWKTRLPDMSRIMRDMLPKRIGPNAESEQIDALIKETCVAECIHHWLCIFSVGIYFFWKNYIGVILIFVYVGCNVPFILIQRYNRPHLIILREKMIKRKEKRAHAYPDPVL